MPPTMGRGAHRSRPAARGQRRAVAGGTVPLAPAHPCRRCQQARWYVPAPLWPEPAYVLARPCYGTTAAAVVPDQALALRLKAPEPPVAALRRGGQSGARGICATPGIPGAG